MKKQVEIAVENVVFASEDYRKRLRKKGITLASPIRLLPTLPRRWRVYYAWRGSWPYLAAIDEGTIATQRLLKWVQAERGFITKTDVGRRGRDLIQVGRGAARQASTYYVERRDRRGKLNEPTWWIEVYGVAQEIDGGVMIR